MTDPTLDPAIASRCELAREVTLLDRAALALLGPVADRLDANALGLWLLSARMLGLSIGPALARSMPRVHSGYMPETQRRAVAHRSYSAGLLTAPRRLRSEDRAKLAAAKLFGRAHVVGLPVQVRS